MPNIIEPYAHLMDLGSREDGIKLLRKIEWCGRISHRSEDSQTDDSWERFITAVVMKHGDWSIVEHATATVDFMVDRGLSHEIVRHRLCSFTQSSTRFVNHTKKPMEFIQPVGLEVQQRIQWEYLMGEAEAGYSKMVGAGAAPQIARSVLPNSLATRLVVTTNLRNWRHVLLLRTTKETHPQLRQVMIPLLKEFQERVPLLYDDIVPENRQVAALSRAR